MFVSTSSATFHRETRSVDIEGTRLSSTRQADSSTLDDDEDEADETIVRQDEYAVRSVKGELLGKGRRRCICDDSGANAIVDGLTHVFATIKHTPDIRDLPANYQAVIEWARIS